MQSGAHKQIFAVVLGLFIIGVVAGPTFAQKPFLNRLKGVKLVNEKNGNCHLCHNNDKEKGESPDKEHLNSFGVAVQKAPEAKTAMGKDDEHKFTPPELDAVEKAVRALADKDSDGDGATNGEEMALGTSPGDAKSTPDKAELEKHRKK